MILGRGAGKQGLPLYKNITMAKTFQELCEDCVKLMERDGIKKQHVRDGRVDFPISDRAISQIKYYAQNGEGSKANPKPKWGTVFDCLKYFGKEELSIKI